MTGTAMAMSFALIVYHLAQRNEYILRGLAGPFTGPFLSVFAE